MNQLWDGHPGGARLGSGGMAHGKAGRQQRSQAWGLLPQLRFFFLRRKKFFEIDGLGIKKKKKNLKKKKGH